MSPSIRRSLNAYEQILRATEGEKNGLRDRCMILMCFYHGLRISELLGIRTPRPVRFYQQTVFFVAPGVLISPFVHRIIHRWHPDNDTTP
ncbi:tyrosine-type recombinase/integrase [Enterobacter ludwigii]|uniref:tyrosine-type recombinase/integrase n=2 Tax=Enterobacter TaxID=547 RepID=UPI003BEF1283